MEFTEPPTSQQSNILKSPVVLTDMSHLDRLWLFCCRNACVVWTTDCWDFLSNSLAMWGDRLLRRNWLADQTMLAVRVMAGTYRRTTDEDKQFQHVQHINCK